MVRDQTIKLLKLYNFRDYADKPIPWTEGQLEIIDCILNRSSPDGIKRVQVIASTQYGKSMAVGAALVIRASLKPEKWAIVAGTTEKARIIMEYVTMFSLTCDLVRTQLEHTEPLDRLRMRRSKDILTYRVGGEVRVYSADATRVAETSKALMGFGSPNVIEDESALISDTLQATVMRMLGGTQDNFLMKIGNPFNRNHFLKTWENGRYHRVFIDYKRALAEGRYTEAYIAEMREEAMFDILYECKFPEEGLMDTSGWLPLITETELARAQINDEYPIGFRRLGADVAGGGRNFSVMVLRSYNIMKKIYKKNESDTMMFASNILNYSVVQAVKPKDVFIDKVGVGKGAFDRLRQLRDDISGINGGSEPLDPTRFVNLRAEMYWRLREWILRGGKIVSDPDWVQLTKVKYRIGERTGKIQIMPKEQMLKDGIDSPDVADAASLTFAVPDPITAEEMYSQRRIAPQPVPNLDPYEKSAGSSGDFDPYE